MTGWLTHSLQFSGTEGEGVVTLAGSEAQVLGAAEDPHGVVNCRNPVNSGEQRHLPVGVTQAAGSRHS